MRTVTDILGRQVNVHVPVRRVILGEGRQLYLVAALDKENPLQRIVGWRKDLIQVWLTSNVFCSVGERRRL